MKLHEITSKHWFHRTTQDRVDSIMRFGLRPNSETNLTLSGEWSFQLYGCRPIFLSQQLETSYKEHASVLLKVDVSGLDLVADFPSLVDFGAYYDIDDYAMWFKNGPEMSFDDLLNPSSKVCKNCIQKTKTAACLTNISPSKIFF